LSQTGRAVRKALASVDPSLAPPSMQTYGDLIAAQSQQPRSMATLLAVLAFEALLLALSGIFGIVSYSVSQRYGEFGVRLALGARSNGILLDVLVRALRTTALGVVIGVTIAAFGAQAVSTQLYGIAPLDAATFAAAVSAIALCAVVASLLPALRAMRVDPATALRYE
jgi:ABC-type antimicrobial peptide transport system permease subunit